MANGGKNECKLFIYIYMILLLPDSVLYRNMYIYIYYMLMSSYHRIGEMCFDLCIMIKMYSASTNLIHILGGFYGEE